MMKTRRDLLLLAGLAGTVPWAWGSHAQQTRELAPTPACADGHDDATPPQTEGPYFTPNSPQRSTLFEAGMAGMAGTRLRVGGLALSRGCRPLAHVLIDLWQADARGDYDNQGFRLRGHQFTDAQGRWQFDTIVPALYPGRTRHLHVKLQPPGGAILTTQLYFPGEAGNARDRIFDKRLLMNTAGDGEHMIARYDFVLAVR
jgi:protocatechuate 3,4-dioxygenase beta subunit